MKLCFPSSLCNSLYKIKFNKCWTILRALTKGKRSNTSAWRLQKLHGAFCHWCEGRGGEKLKEKGREGGPVLSGPFTLPNVRLNTTYAIDDLRYSNAVLWTRVCSCIGRRSSLETGDGTVTPWCRLGRKNLSGNLEKWLSNTHDSKGDSWFHFMFNVARGTSHLRVVCLLPSNHFVSCCRKSLALCSLRFGISKSLGIPCVVPFL